MKKLLVALAIALPIAFSGAELAHASGSANRGAISKKESKCQKAARQGKPCQISFGVGDDVEGGTVSPDGDDVYSQIDALFGGLIKVRYDFADKIVAAADDI
jgi:hypothetical protein